MMMQWSVVKPSPSPTSSWRIDATGSSWSAKNNQSRTRTTTSSFNPFVTSSLLTISLVLNFEFPRGVRMAKLVHYLAVCTWLPPHSAHSFFVQPTTSARLPWREQRCWLCFNRLAILIFLLLGRLLRIGGYIIRRPLCTNNNKTNHQHRESCSALFPSLQKKPLLGESLWTAHIILIA